MSSAVLVVDAGGTNLTSVLAALQRLGAPARLSADPAELREARRVILPGVGAAAPAMQRLESLGLTEVIRSLTQPVLGICLGMQLLYERSEEGDVACLGLIPGTVSRLAGSAQARVPHVGWNRLELLGPAPLLAGLPDEPYAYFVHSFAAPPSQFTLATSLHGSEFSAAAGRANFWGTQFHPERSAGVGARILRNFLEDM